MEEASLFLSDSDLKIFTGFEQKTKQINFLRSKGVPFEINGRGKPIIRKSDIDKQLPVIPEKTEWRSNKTR